MTLIHRYTISSEYAELLSTSATTTPRPHRSKHTPAWLSNHLASEKTAWQNALCPSLEELQAVSRRMLADPELSQTNVFNFCAPLFIFISLLLVGVVVPRHAGMQMAAARILGGVSNNKTELALVLMVFFAGILGGLVVLRTIIWAVALGVELFAEKDMKSVAGETEKSQDSFELTQSNIIIGGMFA